MTTEDRSVVAGGSYRHYKGDVYTVMWTCTHTETGEVMVVYHKKNPSTAEDIRLWARPFDKWDDPCVDHRTDKTVPRFRLVGDDET